jgi:hypothetical protein
LSNSANLTTAFIAFPTACFPNAAVAAHHLLLFLMFLLFLFPSS